MITYINKPINISTPGTDKVNHEPGSSAIPQSQLGSECVQSLHGFLVTAFNKEVAQKFIRLLAGNVSEKENQLLGLAYNSLRKKVAEALIFLLKKYKYEGDADFTIDISREGLATIAGTATESLIRTLSDFKTEKLVDVKGGCIKILDEKKLASMFN